MITCSNADGKWSEKKMEGEDGLRTVECLRGRLLAERAASRVAKEEADQIGSKLVDLENQLKVEIKSRNRAEKKLRFLMKKLESLNISYVSSEGSEHSSSLEKSDITSLSSSSASSSSAIKEPEDKEPKTQITDPKKCDLESTDLKHSVPNQCHYSSSIEENFDSSSKDNGEMSGENELNQDCADSRRDDQSLKSSIQEEKNEENDRGQDVYVDNSVWKNEEKDRDQDDYYVDNSLALVLVDSPVASKIVELPPITDASVQAVLDALRNVREKLQHTRERRHMNMINVGSG